MKRSTRVTGHAAGDKEGQAVQMIGETVSTPSSYVNNHTGGKERLPNHKFINSEEEMIFTFYY
jgi:hypothetical protein